MGLDMYLHARRYVHKPWSEEDQAQYDEIARTVQEKLCSSPIPFTDGFTAEFTVMYWRKANAIHNWFVENHGDGVDECQDIYVGIDGLKDLRDLCGEVLKMFPEGYGEDSPELSGEVAEAIAEKLPPTSGFFFGGTEIDYWYYWNIAETHEVLTKLIEWDQSEVREGLKYSDWDYTYRASW